MSNSIKKIYPTFKKNSMILALVCLVISTVCIVIYKFTTPENSDSNQITSAKSDANKFLAIKDRLADQLSLSIFKKDPREAKAKTSKTIEDNLNDFVSINCEKTNDQALCKNYSKNLQYMKEDLKESGNIRSFLKLTVEGRKYYFDDKGMIISSDKPLRDILGEEKINLLYKKHNENWLEYNKKKDELRVLIVDAQDATRSFALLGDGEKFLKHSGYISSQSFLNRLNANIHKTKTEELIKKIKELYNSGDCFTVLYQAYDEDEKIQCDISEIDKLRVEEDTTFEKNSSYFKLSRKILTKMIDKKF